MTPHLTSGQNRYCRLFPPAGERPDLSTEDGLEVIRSLFQLAKGMKDDGTTLQPGGSRFAISAGYTYFGQFLDHDLTHDRSSASDAWSLEPEEILNEQSCRLDLSHLYGRGPWDRIDRRLYTGIRLRVGAVCVPRKRMFAPQRRSFDVAVGPDGPLVADKRACENVILRQLTAVFCRLHNLAVDQFSSDYSDDKELFERARLQTTWQFQRLVWEDYLPRVLSPGVYAKVFRRRQPSIDWKVFSIPVEFSVAAMRFGHSMVRERYFLSERDFCLRDLLKHGQQATSLDATLEIDWGRFVQNASATAPSAVTAQPIDTGITEALHHIPLATIQLFNSADFSLVPLHKVFTESGGLPLPFLSLLRAAGLRLPSGQTVAEAFGEPVLDDTELASLPNGHQVASAGAVLLEKTPLFYYILRESEIRCNGNRLGPTGSHLVAETIYGSLLHDPNSILNHPGMDWCESSAPGKAGGICRPLWNLRGGRQPILSLRELLFHSPGFPAAA